ncbi:YitT family protein [Clostridium sp.]|uniref:YitT family protein n=1 Tax=Clostridium sp. TaxID=1506 RepID=UPI002A90DE4A|nr:YitT family protein [Clostridium sp.]MDY6012032.1 YitT family protein [Clostridium sp.]
MKQNIKEYGIITLGVILVAVALEYFFIPNNLAAGGVSGLAVVISHYFPSLTVGVLTLIMNIILFVIAFIVVGGDFGLKTIYASFGLSFLLWFMDAFIHPQALTTDLLISSVFGTVLTAIGLAMVFNVNASTGGTDILAKILNKYTSFNMGISLLCVDFLVTFLGAITFGVDKGFYALLSVLLNGPLIDKIISFLNQKKEITIISDKNEEIAKFIMTELRSGCTALEGSGLYSKQEKKIIYSVLSKKELEKLKQFIECVDSEAFYTIGQIEEVQGKDFLKVSGV